MTADMKILNDLESRSGWDLHQVLVQDQSLWRSRLYAEDLSYPKDGLSKLLEIEEQSFWFRYRNEVILRYIKAHELSKEFWEVGAGNGFVASYLQSKGYDTCAVEPDAVGAMNASLRGVLTIQALLEDLDLPNQSLLQIGCFDVIEHIEDAISFLRSLHRVLQTGGRLWLTVPAMQALWSGTDIRSGHYRRYGPSLLREQLEASGFKVRSIAYFMQSMVLPVYLMRTLAKDQDHDDLNQDVKHLNPMGQTAGQLLYRFMQMEGFFSRMIPCWMGTSLIAAAERRED